MIGGAFIPQCFHRHQEGAFGDGFQNAAASRGDDFPDTVTDEPVQDLGGCSGTNRCLAKNDLFSLVTGDIDGIVLGGADERGNPAGIGFFGIHINVISRKCEDTFFGELQI